MFLIRTENLSRVYRLGGRDIPALSNISIEIDAGRLIALRGRSGSGKTTLLNCLSGLDRPTSGRVWIDGREVTAFNEQQRVDLRRRQLGFIFQSHALLPTYSAAENIDFVLRLAGWSRADRLARVGEVLKLVGLQSWQNHRPFELSGGQQQRISIARALAIKPQIILADEPTGELDAATSERVLEIFRHVSHTEQTTILIATHDMLVDDFADEVLHLQDGEIVTREIVKQ